MYHVTFHDQIRGCAVPMRLFKRMLSLLLLWMATFHVVAQAPTIVVPPADIFLDRGTNHEFTVSAANATRYQWQLNGVNINGATSSNLFLTDIGITNGGTYTVVVANDSGALTSTPAFLRFNDVTDLAGADSFLAALPLLNTNNSGVIQSDSSAATKETGEPDHAGKPGGRSVWYELMPQTDGIMTLEARGSGFDTLLTVYRLDAASNTNFNDLTEVASDEDRGGFHTSIVAFNVSATERYVVAIDGFDGQGGQYVLSWDLDSTCDTRPIILQQPESIFLDEGQPARLEVRAYGTPPLYFFWRSLGSPAGLAQPQSEGFLDFPSVNLTDSGQYFVTISNHLGLVDSEVVQLTVIPDTTSPSLVGAEGHPNLDIIFLTFDEPLDEVSGSNPLNYTVNNGVLVTGAFTDPSGAVVVLQTSMHVPGTMHQVDVTGVTDRFGNAVPGGTSAMFPAGPLRTDMIPLNLPQGTITIANPLHRGNNQLIEILPFVQEGTQIHKYDPAGNNYLTWTFMFGNWVDEVFAPGGTLAPGEGAWITSPSPQFISLNGTIREPFPPSPRRPPGLYLVSAPVPQNAIFEQLMGFPPVPGDKVYLNNITHPGPPPLPGDPSFDVHTFGPSGWDTVPVLNAGRSAFVELAAVSPPTILAEPTDVITSAGGAAEFAVAVEGSEPLFYQWRLNGFDLSNATHDTLSLPFVGPEDMGNYDVIIGNDFGVVQSAVAGLVICEELPVIEAHPASQTTWFGSNVTLSVLAPGTSLAFEWKRNGITIPGATGPVYNIPDMGYDDVGRYAVEVRNILTGRRVVSRDAFLEIGPDPNYRSRDKVQDLFLGGGTGAAVLGPRAPGGFGASTGFGLLSIISGVPSFEIFHLNGDTQTGECNHCSRINNASQWFGIQVPDDGVLFLDTIGSTNDAGGIMATTLAVYNNVAYSALCANQLACDVGGAANGLSSELSLAVVSGQEILIAVDGTDYETGTAKLNWRLSQPPLLVAPFPATNVVLAAGSSNNISSGIIATNPPATYQWFFNGELIAGPTQSQLTFAPLLPGDSGLYSVVASNEFGIVTNTGLCLLATSQEPHMKLVNVELVPASQGPDSFSFDVIATAPYVLQRSASAIKWISIWTNAAGCVHWTASNVVDTTASTFHGVDFLAVDDLVSDLTTATNGVSGFLWDEFTSAAQAVLEDSGSTTEEKRAELVREFNRIMTGGTSIYNAQRFERIRLSRRTAALLAESPTGSRLTRLNRLLLEDAYPEKVLRTSRGLFYQTEEWLVTP